MQRLDLDGCSLEEIYNKYNQIHGSWNRKVVKGGVLGAASSVASSLTLFFY